MTTANVTSFNFGRTHDDFPVSVIDSEVAVQRYVGGFKGELGNRWNWDGYYAWSQTDQELAQRNATDFKKLYSAVDVVRNGAGQIVCRTNLNGQDPGCVPLNLFGEGSPSADAIKYVIGDPTKWLKLNQTVAAINISGDLGERFQFGAGPIGIAAGGGISQGRG